MNEVILPFVNCGESGENIVKLSDPASLNVLSISEEQLQRLLSCCSNSFNKVSRNAMINHSLSEFSVNPLGLTMGAKLLVFAVSNDKIEITYVDKELQCQYIADRYETNNQRQVECSFFTEHAIERGHQGFHNQCLWIYACVQYALLHPERIFRTGKGGKHTLNRTPTHKNDEQLYSCINAMSSIITSTVATGKGRKHTHEYDVRGFYRHYKNGKISFVKPHTRCKGRGTKIIHEYTIGGGE